MKFMMNGALTLGTLDGANVEINELVGDENMMLFGMRAEEVTALESLGTYEPILIYDNDLKIKRVVDSLTNSFFSNVSKEEFEEIRAALLVKDQYFVLKDFNSYRDAQAQLNKLYQNKDLWLQKAIINTAKSGFFSTDRTISDYNEEIWKLKEVK
jgi:starch phosphorylase